jgi:DNA polymerase sigma
MVLFVKHWARVRGINSPYRGTLSSYGYVLMVLHFLVNVAKPFVCPNLQHSASRNPPQAPQEAADAMAWEGGAHTKFWNDEEGIKRSASRHELSQNSQPIGYLLLGFFEYYAHGGPMTTYRRRCFDWGRDALSLRTQGGILSKFDKGWTGAKTVTEVKTIAAPPGSASKLTDSSLSSCQGVPPNGFPVIQEVREIRHRYLFAIEDPFELDHNVARTVTHNGIVAIRDEFRRAWRILKDAGTKEQIEELLQVASVVEEENSRKAFEQLLLEIHGKVVFDDLERA